MNPFTTPDRLFISRRPQDMRAGIQQLASKVAADFGMDPTDGSLYCFVSLHSKGFGSSSVRVRKNDTGHSA